MDQNVYREVYFRCIPIILEKKIIPSARLRLVCKKSKEIVDNFLEEKMGYIVENMDLVRKKSLSADSITFNEDIQSLHNTRQAEQTLASGEHFSLKVDRRQLMLQVANFGPVPSIVKGIMQPKFGQYLEKVRRIYLKGLFRVESMNGPCVANLVSVVPVFQSLTSLSIKGSFGDEGVMAIAGVLAQDKPCIQDLFLESDQQVERGACDLARILAKNPHIRHVYIDNLLRRVGVQAFSAAIFFSRTLVSISLRNCKIDNEQAGWISEALGNSDSNLETLDLCHNKIELQGADALISQGQRSASLRYLNLSHNRFQLQNTSGVNIRGHIGVLQKQVKDEGGWKFSEVRLLVYCETY
eukprot:TRINITY_DN3710_c0_g1_i1.p1 TRINITY_DN3710_c0_g1~~TRINITY_DN3710_c0_g1_i1.p1  ORF type:complete len:354 (-),score=14.27 TRINITY_DN3710_c0_g1_i1:202-1263(-)